MLHGHFYHQTPSFYESEPKKRKAILSLALLSASFACEEGKTPKRENIPEVITRVELKFEPDGGGKTSLAIASDPSRGGAQGMQISQPITLNAKTTYTLSVDMLNENHKSDDPHYKVTTEIEEEKNDHQIFFSWTGGLFSSPEGDGNEDNAKDPVLYLDKDDKLLPVGLKTKWVTGDGGQKGKFKIILKHQPDLKTASSSVKDGETELDLEFAATIQ